MCEILNASQNYAWSNWMVIPFGRLWGGAGQIWESVLVLINCDDVRYQSEGAKKAGGHMSLELRKKTWVDCTR